MDRKWNSLNYTLILFCIFAEYLIIIKTKVKQNEKGIIFNGGSSIAGGMR